jgi:septal ring factor EnvC (AmiA/AmiB activator)
MAYKVLWDDELELAFKDKWTPEQIRNRSRRWLEEREGAPYTLDQIEIWMTEQINEYPAEREHRLNQFNAHIAKREMRDLETREVKELKKALEQQNQKIEQMTKSMEDLQNTVKDLSRRVLCTENNIVVHARKLNQPAIYA